jgi:hypothetical protein
MRLFARWIELANVVTVQRPHDTDSREHRRAAFGTGIGSSKRPDQDINGSPSWRPASLT